MEEEDFEEMVLSMIMDFEEMVLHRFAQLSEREQRLVGVDKVLLFVKSIN